VRNAARVEFTVIRRSAAHISGRERAQRRRAALVRAEHAMEETVIRSISRVSVHVWFGALGAMGCGLDVHSAASEVGASTMEQLEAQMAAARRRLRCPDDRELCRGFIDVDQSSAPAVEDGYTYASAFFYTGDESVGESTYETIGDCTLEMMRDSEIPDRTVLSVGTLTVEGITECEGAPDEEGYYDFCYGDPGSIWDPRRGGLVRVSAPGEDLPAFDVAMRAPRERREQIQPVTTSMWDILPREADGSFVFRWSGGTGTVTVQVGGVGVSELVLATITCTAPASARRITIAGALLDQITQPHANFETGEWTDTSGVFSSYIATERRVRVGGVPTVVSLTQWSGHNGFIAR
jgi:hypothetical protein